jgi:Protein of unknown function (DUF4235)
MGAPVMISRERKRNLGRVCCTLGGLLARGLIRPRRWAIRKNTPTATPFDPTDSRFSCPDALLWAAAAGIGLGIAKAVRARLAAFGWEAATGTLPSGVVEEPAIH